MEPSSEQFIYWNADRCILGFDKLTESLEKDPVCDDFSPQASKDEYARFRVWANNIGALKHVQSHSSMDRRLEDAPQIRTKIIKILKYLYDSLTRASEIASGLRENRIATNLDEELNVEFSSDDSMSSAESDEEEQPPQIRVSTTEQVELYEAVKSSISSLFKFSMVVRKPVPRGRYRNSEDLVPIDPSFDINRVREKFPALRQRPWLAERLGKAITRRREYLRYRQEHRHRLTTATEKGQKDVKSVLGDEEEQTAPSTKPTTFVPDGGSTNESYTFERASEASLTSFATPQSTNSNFQRLRVPDPPQTCSNGMVFEYGEPFECPYCYTIQIVKHYPDWRRHVFRDLQPYVCTFENCSAPLFSRRHEWFNHEMEIHRREFTCTKCGKGPWKSSKDIMDHLNRAHPSSWSQAQLAVIVQSCSRPWREFPATSCPLCNDWISPKKHHVDPEFLSKTTKERYQRHLADHLDQLALSALPMASVDEDDQNSDDDSDGKESDHESGKEVQVNYPEAGEEVQVVYTHEAEEEVQVGYPEAVRPSPFDSIGTPEERYESPAEREFREREGIKEAWDFTRNEEARASDFPDWYSGVTYYINQIEWRAIFIKTMNELHAERRASLLEQTAKDIKTYRDEVIRQSQQTLETR